MLNLTKDELRMVREGVKLSMENFRNNQDKTSESFDLLYFGQTLNKLNLLEEKIATAYYAPGNKEAKAKSANVDLPASPAAKALIKYHKTREGFNVKQVLTVKQGMLIVKTKQKFHKISKRLKFFGVHTTQPHRMKQYLVNSGQNTCVKCGVVGDHFNLERHKNAESNAYNITLYGWKGEKEVAMTWDHIIPVALGGADSVENAQCMCSDCNVEKGHNLSIFDIAKIVTDPNVLKMYKSENVAKKPGIEKLLAQMKQNLSMECNRIKHMPPIKQDKVHPSVARMVKAYS